MFAAKIGVSLFSIIFSNILDRSGRRLIGLWDVGSDGFLPGLGIIIICPIFQWVWKYSSLKIALYICVIALIPSPGSSLRRETHEMRKYIKQHTESTDLQGM